MQECACLPLPWCEPLDVLARVADEPYAVALLSDGSPEGHWSYVAHRPAERFGGGDALADALLRWRGSSGECPAGAPPFRGGAIGLAAYEWGATMEPTAPQKRDALWPDLAGGFYDGLLAFDHWERRAWAIGRGVTASQAQARAAEAAASCRGQPGMPRLPPAATFFATGTGMAYREAVEDVVEAVASGEIFQANIARRWSGQLQPGAAPLDLLAALIQKSPAPFAGYLRLPGLALVSNSPERFLQVSGAGEVRTQPIKGTRPRGRTPEEDAAFAEALLGSAKDHAENLMIVDLMRNDLSRACLPGSVKVPSLCALQSFANVHHLVSTVTGRLAAGQTAADLFARAFPPGSITGAPKLQAMAVIARHEPPRGPYCGSLFWAGCDGAFDSSVLIRTIALSERNGGWHFEVRAGAAVTADSIAAEEDRETIAKVAAIRAAMTSA